MKTAMQQLIEHIQINATKFSLMNTYNILKEIEPYLEKEKEQIVDAYLTGADYTCDEEVILANEYYNKTYKK
jgi:hypothetical protein